MERGVPPLSVPWGYSGLVAPLHHMERGSLTTKSGCGTGGFCERVRQLSAIRRGEVQAQVPSHAVWRWRGGRDKLQVYPWNETFCVTQILLKERKITERPHPPGPLPR